MANMMPETLQGVSVQSPAERLLFTKFQEQLSDHFTVIHSVSWISKPGPDEPASDGEADFVILHPKMGVLVLEVKGGQIGFDKDSEWYSVKKNGETVAIKDPFRQARRNKYALKDKISTLPNWQRAIPTIGHAVAFPDGVIDIDDLRPDIEAEIILFHTDLTDIEGWVRRCLKYCAGDNFRPPGDDGLEILSRLLRKSWLMREPKLGEQVRIGKSEIHRYTEEQFQLLDWLNGHPRVAIKGCAGSGKTLLAIEKARRLADEGFRVLFTCFNNNLAEYLKSRNPNNPNLTIVNFHALCAKYAHETGFNQNKKWDSSRSDYFSSVMPEALTYAADQDDNKYLFDAVVVDEGQDFHENWWIALELILKFREKGVMYIFYDDNQLVYSHEVVLPVENYPYSLKKNCRNTIQIHNYIKKYYKSDKEIFPSELSGPEILFHKFDGSNKELKILLTEIFSRLVFSENVSTGDVVLLSPGGYKKGPLKEIMTAGSFKFVDNETDQPREIYSTTIRLFKGLERSVVVLLLEPDSRISDELIYVGASRAEYHLEIIHNKSLDISTKQNIGIR